MGNCTQSSRALALILLRYQGTDRYFRPLDSPLRFRLVMPNDTAQTLKIGFARTRASTAQTGAAAPAHTLPKTPARNNLNGATSCLERQRGILQHGENIRTACLDVRRLLHVGFAPNPFFERRAIRNDESAFLIYGLTIGAAYAGVGRVWLGRDKIP